jgi:hypothetical protein
MATTHNHSPASLKRARGAGFVPGRGKPPGSGRKPGGQNLVSRDVKAMIIEATRRIGGVDRLTEWIMEDPKHEMLWWTQIWPRLLPLQLRGPGPGGAFEHNIAIDPGDLMKRLAERNLPLDVFGACVPSPAEMKLIEHNGAPVTSVTNVTNAPGCSVTQTGDGSGG